MKVHFHATDPQGARWQRRSLERLRQALRQLQRLLARVKVRLEDMHRAVLAEPRPVALALIPIRAVQPQSSRRSHWRLE